VSNDKTLANQYRHEFDDDAVCIHCNFDGAEWSHWKRNTYEGRASDAKAPLCERRQTWADQLLQERWSK
jgi:hypothetical protein